MPNTSIVPWRRSDKSIPIKRELNDPLTAFPEKIYDMFERFFEEFSLAPRGVWENGMRYQPQIDITETDKEIKVTAELPGMDEKDIEVSLTKDTLSIRGEKREEKEEKKRHYYHIERSYGSFQRSMLLPNDVEQEKVEAIYKNGVLTINLPKIAEAQRKSKIITVKSN